MILIYAFRSVLLGVALLLSRGSFNEALNAVGVSFFTQPPCFAIHMIHFWLSFGFNVVRGALIYPK